MKIRDLWQRAGENRTRPHRGSALTNRPKVNVLDRPWITFSQRWIPLSMPHSRNKKPRPFRYSVFCIESLYAFHFDSRNFRQDCFFF